MAQRAQLSSAVPGSGNRSVAQGGRSQHDSISSEKLQPLKQKNEKALADVHGHQATSIRSIKALATTDTQILQLQAKADADAAQLAHFEALAEQAQIDLNEGDEDEFDSPSDHGENSATTELLTEGTSDPSSNTPPRRKPTASASLMTTFIRSLRQSAEQSQLRLSEAIKRRDFQSPRTVKNSKPVFHAPVKGAAASGPLSALFRTIKKEEKVARRTSELLSHEPRSQDPPDVVWRNDGYEDDGFVIDDELATSDSSDSDDDSLFVDSDDENGDPASLQAFNRDLVNHTVSAHLSKRTPCFDDLTDVAPDVSPLGLRIDIPVFVQLDLLLSSWLRTALNSIPVSQFLLFFSLIHSCRGEWTPSVFKIIVRRFLPLSKQFVRFIWHVIRDTLPEHGLNFKLVFERLHRKSKLPPPKTSISASDSTTPSAPPRTKRPVLRDLEDIFSFMTVFLVEYSKYKRDFITSKFAHDSLFQCFTPTQQQTLASMASTTTDACQAMSDDEICELVRKTYGLKSQAAAIHALKSVPFAGSALDKSSWSKFHSAFKNVILQVFAPAMPSPKQIAGIFIRCCPFPFMRTTLVAQDLQSLPSALASSQALLDDPNFIRDALKHTGSSPAASDRRDRDPKHGQQRDSHRDFKPRDRDRDRERERERDRPKFPIDSAAPRAAQAPEPPVHGAPAAFRAPTQKCSRCGGDHPTSCCIRGKHSDGRELPRLSKEDYVRNKANLELFIRRQTIAAIREADGEAGHLDFYSSESDADGHSDTQSSADDNPGTDEDFFCGAIVHCSDSSGDEDAHSNDIDSSALAFHHLCACIEMVTDSDSASASDDQDVLEIHGSRHTSLSAFFRPVCAVSPSPFDNDASEYFSDTDILGADTPSDDERIDELWMREPVRYQVRPQSPCASDAVRFAFSPLHAPDACYALLNDPFGLASSSAVVDIVPAPSLMLSGDVESNPGPKRKVPAPKRKRGYSKWELYAICLFSQLIAPLPTATAQFAQAPCLQPFCQMLRAPCVHPPFVFPILMVLVTVFSGWFIQRKLSILSHLAGSLPPHSHRSSSQHETNRRFTCMMSALPTGNAHVASTIFSCDNVTTYLDDIVCDIDDERLHLPRPSPNMPYLFVSFDTLHQSITVLTPGNDTTDASAFDHATRNPFFGNELPPSPPLTNDGDVESNPGPPPCFSAIVPAIDLAADDDGAPTVAAVSASQLLDPPFFVGIITPPDETFEIPAQDDAVICALDSMCLGQSVINKATADARRLPRSPCNISSRTATGSKVRCTEIAHFRIHVHINGQWVRIVHHALVWEVTVEPLLLCNDFCLQHMFVYLCHPQADRVKHFGDVCFSLDWHKKLSQQASQVCAVYNEDVMSAEIEDLCDLSAPLKWGQQDPKSVPPDGRHYARLYPEMLQPIPRDADSRLPLWRAHIDESQLALYSWPTCKLKELAEDRIPLHFHSPLYQEMEKLVVMHFAEPITEYPPVGICD
jgi:hypothetical protein